MNEHRCMRDILVDDVITAAQRVLAEVELQ
jgi:hypothetical protein